MKFGASIRNRHFIARLDKGEDFIETLKAFFIRERVKTCVFSGHGEFSKCKLQAFNPDCRLMETIFSTESFVSVPMIEGNITLMGTEIIVQASCVLNYRPCGQLHTVAGLIQQAKVFSAELHLTVFEDLRINRSFDTLTGQVPMTQFKSSYDEYGGNVSSLGAGADFSSLGESALGSSALGSSQLQIPNPEVVRRTRSVSATAADASGLSVDLAAQSSVPKRRTRKSIDPGDLVDPNAESQSAAFTDAELSESKLGKKTTASTIDPGVSTTGRRIRASITKDGEKSTTSEEKASGIQKGDWLRHPSLGICNVENVLPGNCIQIRPEGGSSRDISLSYFKTVQIEDYRGCRCFELERI